MAETPKSAVMAEPDVIFDFRDFESSWIGRYRFSRSVCYPLDLSLTPGITFAHRPQITSKGSFTSQANIGSGFASPALPSKLLRRSPSGPLSFRSFDGGYGSSSSASSPGLIKSSSSASFQSSAESSDEPTEEDKALVVKRAASWSQYLDGSGGERAVEAAEHWMVDMSQLFLGQKFATGSYSRLYHGLYRGKEVAVKLMRPPDEDEQIALRLERQFRHEFLAACRKPAVCCIVTEYLSNGSVRSFLQRSGPGSRPMKVILGMALDVARGMEYLHSQGVIHRDLKSENLCLDKDLFVKITDFGVSCHFTEDDNLNKDTGTYRWMAPEMISQKAYTKKVDVYSFGIVLWELYTGLIPFEEMSAVQAAYAVVNKCARPEIPPDCPRVLSEMMKQCWSSNPDKRPDFWEIVKRLEQFEGSSKEDFSFSTWQNPSQHTSLLLRCFKGCR
ncbi:hypothetical protein O6H91_16G031700 [Diphasiastrum complanatum]|uniref:Uncharacterized protein n=1 Tax=Diphasiastrum complanatum TaxID=34168 RepID=A0ACC2BB62_DIPCM|nr:hypothetical protein O6H91_16G031700 [Diphasiastrum complanatum]